MDGEQEGRVPPAGELLSSTAAELGRRKAGLEPLVNEFERLLEILDAMGELPDVGDGSSAEGTPAHVHADLVRHLGRMSAELRGWTDHLRPLVREYEQILHILAAFDTVGTAAPTVGTSRRRPRGPRRAGGGSASGGRLEQLRALLAEPRARADIAQRMGVSPSRVTSLLDQLAQNGEVEEIRDPQQPARKLWSLVRSETSDGPPAEPVEDSPPDGE